MTTDPLLQRLSRLSWPRPALDLPEPAAGQLWRAAWGETACLVVLLGPPRGRVVPVAAASAEETGDETTVLAATEAGLTPAVWGSVTGAIKLFTLEHRLADLTVETFAAVREAVAGTGPRRWASIGSVLDDRALVRAQLVEEIERLVEAEWVPKASGRTLAEQAPRSRASTTPSPLPWPASLPMACGNGSAPRTPGATAMQLRCPDTEGESAAVEGGHRPSESGGA